MKALSILAAAFSLVVLAGCATSNYIVGRDFSSGNVAQISKGKTTTDELRQLFGEPFTKTVVSGNEERWLYTYTSSTANVQSYVVTMKVNSSGNHKMLDVLIRDGRVVNYTFSESATPTINVGPQ